MSRTITDAERGMLNEGVSFQVLGTSYVTEGEKELHDRVVNEGKDEYHRAWYLFCPEYANKGKGIQAKKLYELFHKECYENNLYVKEIMMADLLKMGNKRRYDIELDMGFIIIPDFFRVVYANNYKDIEAPSVLRWMAYVTGRYGVGFVLHSETKEAEIISDFFGEYFIGYYSKYLNITVAEDK